MVQVVQTSIDFFIISFTLTKFEGFGFKVGDDDILVIRFDLVRVVVSLKKRIRMRVER